MSKSLNFAIPQKSIKCSDYLLLFELLLRHVQSLNFSSFDKDCVKSRLRDCAYSPFKQALKIFGKNLRDEKIKDLKNLTENKDLVIQKADKVNAIVILNKNDYVSTFTRILDGTSKFKISLTSKAKF